MTTNIIHDLDGLTGLAALPDNGGACYVTSPPRPWRIPGTVCLPNRMLKALWAHIREVCLNDLDALIDCPTLLVDQVEEWLGTEGSRFRGCRPDAVVCLTITYYDRPALGIYYRNTNNVDLITVAAIYWLENAEKTWQSAQPLD